MALGKPDGCSLHDESHPDHEEVSQKFGFLYDNYSPTAWYWEG